MVDVPINWATEGEYILDDEKRVPRLGDDGAWCRPDLPPGTSSWSRNTRDEIVGLLFVCPCGCGSVGDLSIAAGYGGPVWNLTNGNYEKPSMTPSIQKTSPCRWHGYLTDGVFRPV
jgi:hypothetical protein